MFAAGFDISLGPLTLWTTVGLAFPLRVGVWRVDACTLAHNGEVSQSKRTIHARPHTAGVGLQNRATLTSAGLLN